MFRSARIDRGGSVLRFGFEDICLGAVTPWIDRPPLQEAGLFSLAIHNIHPNVNPGLINPWLINRGVSPFSGDSDHFWREHPP